MLKVPPGGIPAPVVNQVSAAGRATGVDVLLLQPEVTAPLLVTMLQLLKGLPPWFCAFSAAFEASAPEKNKVKLVIVVPVSLTTFQLGVVLLPTNSGMVPFKIPVKLKGTFPAAAQWTPPVDCDGEGANPMTLQLLWKLRIEMIGSLRLVASAAANGANARRVTMHVNETSHFLFISNHLSSEPFEIQATFFGAL